MADLTSDFVDRVVQLGGVKDKVIQVGGFSYTNAENWALVQPPAVRPVELCSLAGLASYVTEVADYGLDVKPFFQVNSPTVVVFKGTLDEDNTRAIYASAGFHLCGFKFGCWYSQEEFIIGLQSQFVDTDELPVLLKVVSSITSEDVRVSLDDGISQEVTANVALAKMQRQTLPTKIPLRPFRTFREVDQPESDFLLRARKDREGIKLALFEADGGMWQLEAVDSIAAYLKEKCPGFVVLK